MYYSWYFISRFNEEIEFVRENEISVLCWFRKLERLSHAQKSFHISLYPRIWELNYHAMYTVYYVIALCTTRIEAWCFLRYIKLN